MGAAEEQKRGENCLPGGGGSLGKVPCGGIHDRVKKSRCVGPPIFFMHTAHRMSHNTMRVCGVLLLLSAAARGLVSKAGSESQSPTEHRRPQNLNHLPFPDDSSRNGFGLTRPGLLCRGGSATAGRGPEAAAGCLAKQGAGKGALPAAAAAAAAGAEKPRGAKGWGQLRRSPESRASLSTELASRGMIRVCTSPYRLVALAVPTSMVNDWVVTPFPRAQCLGLDCCCFSLSIERNGLVKFAGVPKRVPTLRPRQQSRECQRCLCLTISV